ncbi:hypothetical protein A0H81_05068 [Grifola frondosa]|uniref:MARVEL domain-containing protein n=1 Tax=Grifola frondosa TaxID=5627 RepID=A0A1C7MDU4_GRIFR|nr:hypothetical protein A0H81_05068 [Grifola frondosa]
MLWTVLTESRIASASYNPCVKNVLHSATSSRAASRSHAVLSGKLSSAIEAMLVCGDASATANQFVPPYEGDECRYSRTLYLNADVPVLLVLFGLSADRLHYTTHLPPFDPLNNGKSFYDPIVAELLATTIFAMFWSSFIIHIIHRSYDLGRLSSFFAELLGLSALFVLYLVGAAIASTFWGNLFWCHRYFPCRILTTLVAFSWMCWVVVLILMIMSALFAYENSAFGLPLHGRFDPRGAAMAPGSPVPEPNARRSP